MSRWDDVQTTLDESWWWPYLKLAKWTFIMSTPVMLLTISGTLVTICSTSPVNLAAPISPWPDDTIVIFLACERGAATSAAICYTTYYIKPYYMHRQLSYIMFIITKSSIVLLPQGTPRHSSTPSQSNNLSFKFKTYFIHN